MFNPCLLRLMLIACCILAGCEGAHTKVVFEIPKGFTGAFVIRKDPSVSNDWRKSSDAFLLEIKDAITPVRSLDEIEGKYLKFEARLHTGAYVPLVASAGAITHEGIGLFGGSITSGGEMHFYLGYASQAIDYFDRLTGKRSEPHEPTKAR